ncbi:MAG: hypothetical protein QM790_20495 [Nibricoccus sp.]
MGKSPKENLDRINTTTTAWETHRPDKKFGGMTLKEYKAKVQPSIDARATVAHDESVLKASISLREKADEATLAIIKHMVDDVVAQEGEDSEFYEALGYVRASERKSGLSRKSTASKTKSQA